MGHQFARAAVAATLTLAVGACGGGDASGDPPPVLDNARELVAAAEPGSVASSFASDDDVPASELPAPDPSRFEGANRVVNLLTGPSGEPIDIDVWGLRTFENGPILLAADVGFGEATGYVSAPPEYTIAVVGAGAGPDGVVLAEVVNAVADERITAIVSTDERGGHPVTHLFEAGSDTAIAAPEPGSASVVVAAPNLDAFGDELTAAAGSDRFEVGDGSGACRRQRRESVGLEPDLLGDPEPIEIVLEPGEGPATLSIHPWVPAIAACSLPSVLDIDVDVVADSTTLVLVARLAPGRLDAIVLPIPSPIT